MLHEPAAQTKEDNAVPYKTRLGVIMFILYALVYAGFVIINITNPTLMEMTIIFGLNLAANGRLPKFFPMAYAPVSAHQTHVSTVKIHQSPPGRTRIAIK